MTLLLDTHIIFWAAVHDPRLSADATKLIQDTNNDVTFSVASIWEAVIKRSLGSRDLPVEPHLLRMELLSNGYRELPITAEHTLAVADLPNIHRDPFDRILIAQATVENWILLTADPTVARYPGPIKLI